MAASREPDRAAALATSRRAFTLGNKPDMGGSVVGAGQVLIIFSDQGEGGNEWSCLRCQMLRLRRF